MFWQITAAIAASLGLLFAIFVFIYPHLQRWRRRKPLSRIDELRKKMLGLQRQYTKPEIEDEEITTFGEAIDKYAKEFLNELKKISKEKARLYRNPGIFTMGGFRGVTNPEQWRLLASNRNWIEIIEKVIDKYS